MTLTKKTSSLPTLVNKIAYKDERLDSCWLWDLHQLRLLIYQAMLRKLGSVPGHQIAEVTDQLVGCELLLRFIRDQQANAASTLTEYVFSCTGKTVRDLAKYIQTQSESPLLAAVFDTSALNDTLPIPTTDGIDWAVFRSSIPKFIELSNFGFIRLKRRWFDGARGF